MRSCVNNCNEERRWSIQQQPIRHIFSVASSRPEKFSMENERGWSADMPSGEVECPHCRTSPCSPTWGQWATAFGHLLSPSSLNSLDQAKSHCTRATSLWTELFREKWDYFVPRWRLGSLSSHHCPELTKIWWENIMGLKGESVRSAHKLRKSSSSQFNFGCHCHGL